MSTGSTSDVSASEFYDHNEDDTNTSMSINIPTDESANVTEEIGGLKEASDDMIEPNQSFIGHFKSHEGVDLHQKSSGSTSSLHRYNASFETQEINEFYHKIEQDALSVHSVTEAVLGRHHGSLAQKLMAQDHVVTSTPTTFHSHGISGHVAATPTRADFTAETPQVQEPKAPSSVQQTTSKPVICSRDAGAQEATQGATQKAPQETTGHSLSYYKSLSESARKRVQAWHQQEEEEPQSKAEIPTENELRLQIQQLKEEVDRLRAERDTPLIVSPPTSETEIVLGFARAVDSLVHNISGYPTIRTDKDVFSAENLNDVLRRVKVWERVVKQSKSRSKTNR